MKKVSNYFKLSLFLILTMLINCSFAAKMEVTPEASIQKPLAKGTQPKLVKLTPAQQINSLEQISSSKIKSMAEHAVIEAYTYNFRNYQKRLKHLSHYFTKEGWHAFTDALSRSKNINTVKKAEMSVNAKINGQIQILKNRDKNENGQVWRVQVPVKVSYKGEQSVEQNLNVNVTLIPVKQNINRKGIAVVQFIAKEVG